MGRVKHVQASVLLLLPGDDMYKLRLLISALHSTFHILIRLHTVFLDVQLEAVSDLERPVSSVISQSQTGMHRTIILG